jgi:hypothetical protein
VGHVAQMGEKNNAYKLLVPKPVGNRSLVRPRRRWVDNIRMNLGEVGWGDVDRIGLAQDRNRWRALVNSLGKYRIASQLVASRVVLCPTALVSQLYGRMIK